MKFFTVFAVACFAVLNVSAVPYPLARRVDASLVPDFGWQSGVNPTGTGDCDGAVNGPDGQPIKIPCFCPPDRPSVLTNLDANVAAGHAVNNTAVAVTFPTGNSNADQSARITAVLITMQNMRGAGVGCPASATTLLVQQKALAK